MSQYLLDCQSKMKVYMTVNQTISELAECHMTGYKPIEWCI